MSNSTPVQIRFAINDLWSVISHNHNLIDGSESSWSDFFDKAETAVQKISDPLLRDLAVDWFLSYSKFRDIQITQSDPDDYVLPDYLKIGAERFLNT